MLVKEYVVQELATLDEIQLQQVAEYLAFLKFQARRHTRPQFEETQITALYAEFADEDRCLAEESMAEYNASLLAEDAQ